MKKRFRKVFLISGGILVLGAIVFATWAARVLGSFQEGGMSLLQVWQGISDPLSKFPGKDRLTILVIGQDYNHTKQGVQYTKNSRADTIMLISADLVNRKMSAVSVPRDTFVEAPDGKSGKINATFARGGVELLKATLAQQFGVTIDNYVVLKPDAVKEIVDAVGGIEVETIDDMHYDDSWGGLHVHLPEGRQHINGEQAVGFVRFREVNRSRMNERGNIVSIRNVKPSKEEGDIRRTARQQQLIRSLVGAANSPANLWRADKIVNTGFGQIETDLDRVQVLALATVFKGDKGDGMKSATLPGEDDSSGGAYYYRLDQDRAQATVDWLIKGNEAAGRSLIRVAVFNGTKASGAALAAADVVRASGFTVRSTGTGKESGVSEVGFTKATYEEAAKVIASSLGITSVRKLDAESDQPWLPEISVIIGEDRAESLIKSRREGT